MLPRINTILYPTDLGPQSPGVLRHVAGLAQAHQARIVLLYVAEPLSPYTAHMIDSVKPPDAPSAATLHQQSIETLHKQLHDQLERLYRDELPAQHHGEFETRVTEGATAPTILKEAAAVGADLIVMGTHGHSALGEIVLGSIAHKVVYKTATPVLLVPFHKS